MLVGRREISPPPVCPEIKSRYEATVAELAMGLAAWAGDPAVLVLSDRAQEAVVALETAIEPTLAGDGELASLADWGAKYAGAAARIAGILHLAQHGHDRGVRTPLSAETILAAARIGAYYKACAIRAFGEMGADSATADAVYLLGRIRGMDTKEVSERDLHVATQSRFKTKDTLAPVIERLVEHGYLIPLPQKQTGDQGRPASPRYEVVSTC